MIESKDLYKFQSVRENYHKNRVNNKGAQSVMNKVAKPLQSMFNSNTNTESCLPSTKCPEQRTIANKSCMSTRRKEMSKSNRRLYASYHQSPVSSNKMNKVKSSGNLMAKHVNFNELNYPSFTDAYKALYDKVSARWSLWV